MDMQTLGDLLKGPGPVALVAVVAFAFGLVQYLQKQKWDRQALVATEIKELENDPQSRAALQMIDYSRHGRPIDLPFGGKNVVDGDNSKQIVVDAAMLAKALIPYAPGKQFNPEQIAIRDCFDTLLRGWSRLDHLMNTGFIKPDELRPYLSYWVNHAWIREIPAKYNPSNIPEKPEDNAPNIPLKPEQWHLAFWAYADVYNDPVRHLFTTLQGRSPVTGKDTILRILTGWRARNGPKSRA